MTREQAVQELENGKKLTHRLFEADEWIQKTPDGMYLFEDGNKMSQVEFWSQSLGRDNPCWQTGWEIFNEK